MRLQRKKNQGYFSEEYIDLPVIIDIQISATGKLLVWHMINNAIFWRAKHILSTIFLILVGQHFLASKCSVSVFAIIVNTGMVAQGIIFTIHPCFGTEHILY